MSSFQSFPAPAKLNLFLHIVGRRADGYHLLQSVFQLIARQDMLHLRATDDGHIHRVKAVAGVPHDQDLCVRAARLLQEYSGCPLGAEIALDKILPMGGGLGGGSSDAATVLLALNRLWKTNLTRQELLTLGLQLGADVPFFLFGQNAWVEGIGEQLQPISLPPAWYLVLTPAIHVSTPQIFASRELTRNTIPSTIAAFFRGFGHNDLQPVVCQQYPDVASALEWLKPFGDVRMSGSGASVFVAFDSEAEAKRALQLKPETIGGFVAQGLDKHPLYDFAD